MRDTRARDSTAAAQPTDLSPGKVPRVDGMVPESWLLYRLKSLPTVHATAPQFVQAQHQRSSAAPTYTRLDSRLSVDGRLPAIMFPEKSSVLPGTPHNRTLTGALLRKRARTHPHNPRPAQPHPHAPRLCLPKRTLLPSGCRCCQEECPSFLC